MANQLPAIKHIVQLMLEDRSFEQMLGFLYSKDNSPPRGQPFEGLTGKNRIQTIRAEISRFSKIDDTTEHPYLMPGADLGKVPEHQLSVVFY